MELFYRAIILLVIFSLAGWSEESTDLFPPPDLSLTVRNVELHESVTRRTILNAGRPVLTCSDDDPARAFIQSVWPSSPCGHKCFMLIPTSGTRGNSTDYSLHFLPSQGQLHYPSAARYSISIGCTDDVEPATIKELTVTILPNTPPTFPLNMTTDVIVDGLLTNPGDVLYTVNATDKEGDPIYYSMVTRPSTEYIKIGYTNGAIRATNDLLFLCLNSITALVEATDKVNTKIGPVTIYFKISPHNKAPVVTNLDTTITVDENVGEDHVVLQLQVVDELSVVSLNFHMWATSDAALELYKIEIQSSAVKIKTKMNPNYERSDTRSVKLYLEVTDGYCKSATYYLIINIRDKPEPPVLYPKDVGHIEVYEGHIDFASGVSLSDEDLNEVHTYTLVHGSKYFNVQATTGRIYSLIEIDIDKKTTAVAHYIKFKVTDKYGLSSTSIVRFRVYDRNDQSPHFMQNSYVFHATECNEPGTKIGEVAGEDDDSWYNNNDVIIFGGGGGKMAVMANGDVILTQLCIAGETFRGAATIEDHGIYPGPLRGISASMTLICSPCQPPPPPITPPAAATSAVIATTTTTTTEITTAAILVTSKDGRNVHELLAWAIPAVLGGLLWVALTVFMIDRFCCPCRKPCTGRCKQRPKLVNIRPVGQPTPEIAQKVTTPSPAVSIVTPPPSLPPPLPEPYLFGFWRTQYTDQESKTYPKKSMKPMAIEDMPPAEVIPHGNASPPPNLRLGSHDLCQSRTTMASRRNGTVSLPSIPPETMDKKNKKTTCIIF